MPSASTGHQPARNRQRQQGQNRRARFLVVQLLGLMATVALITACSGPTAQEAGRAATEAATEALMLPEQQATYTARKFGPKTPTPGPTPTIDVLIERITMTTQVGGDGAPIGDYESFPSNGGTVYLAVLMHGLRPGTVVEAQIAIPDRRDSQGVTTYGDYVLFSRVDITSDSETAWVAIPINLDGSLVPGPYDAFLVVDGRLVYSITFELTGPGSIPRQL